MEVPHTLTQTQTCTFGATSGASDYAVKPNQFPAFGLMDAIIFVDLKLVSVPQTPSQLKQTHMQTLSKNVLPKPLPEKKWLGKEKSRYQEIQQYLPYIRAMLQLEKDGILYLAVETLKIC